MEALKECGALRFGDFTLTSGKKSRYYIDIKEAVTRPEVLRRIVREMAPHASGYDRVAGVELGAIPIVVALALETSLPYIMIRKRERVHGTKRVFEGSVGRDDRVLLVEDVTTSGGSVGRAAEVLRAAGAIVDRVLCVVDREEGAQESLRKIGIDLVPLLRGKDLLGAR